MPRTIIREIVIDQTRDKIFEALIRPCLIKKWWGANHAIVIAETNGLHVVSWGDNEDNPEYVAAASIKEIIPPAKLLLADFKHVSKDWKIPFSADLETEFNVEPCGDISKLVVRQTGFPDETIGDDFFATCSNGWEKTLASFKKVVEEHPSFFSPPY